MPEHYKYVASAIGAVLVAGAGLVAWLLTQWRASATELKSQNLKVYELTSRIHELERQGKEIALSHFERLQITMLDRVDQLKSRLDELQRRITAISEQMEQLERREQTLHWDYIKLKDERDIAQDELHQLDAQLVVLVEACVAIGDAKNGLEKGEYWPAVGTAVKRPATGFAWQQEPDD